MVNLIYIDESGHKVARSVTNREDYLAQRNTPENVENFLKARGGNAIAKGKQRQYNYNDQLPDGVLKGCCHPSSTFAHDIDCGDEQLCKEIARKLIAMKDEIGLLELSVSSGWGLHAVCRREKGKTILENQVKLSTVTQTEMDTNTHDLQRVLYTGPADEETLLYLDDAIFEEAMTVEESAEEYQLLKERAREGLEEVPPGAKKANKHYRPGEAESEELRVSFAIGNGAERSERKCEESKEVKNEDNSQTSNLNSQLEYNGLPYEDIIRKWWEMYNEGKEPVKSNRDVLTFELAVNLRHICGFDRELMSSVIPCYDGFSQTQKMKCIDSALSEKRTQMPKRLRDVLFEVRRDRMNGANGGCVDEGRGLDEAVQEDDRFYYNRLPRMPQGIRDSIKAVGPQLAMPVLTAICPAIGALATGVQLDVHGQKKGLNLISYIVGDFASRKGDIDPVIDAWMSEVRAQTKMYQDQEDEWRAKKLAAKNKKEQPEEIKLPVRFLTLNNTVANLAERLANTDGKHAFSFTPEADVVAQKWKSSMSDFSVMLRQSYDGSRYEREARSAEAVNVHIEHLLWNVTMCGTPDALYRVVSNYTDGFQSRIAVARTPDNTFSKLEDKPYITTDTQTERIQQVAHLLPLMTGEVVLPKLEAKGREWVENIRLETIKSDDKVRARQRFRVCVTAQRMTCCLMLCKVCETLIQKYGLAGAEKQLKAHPNLWKTALQNAQTPQMLETYDVIADYLLETALFFFRERIENAFASRDYAADADRRRMGKNDSIFERLDMEFSFDGALQHSVAVKGTGVSRNSVHQMLKNWKKQGLVVKTEKGRYRKVEGTVPVDESAGCGH